MPRSLIFSFFSTTEDTEAGSGFWSPGLCVGRRHGTLRVPPPRRSVLQCFPFQKQASFTELTLDLDDGLVMSAQDPSHFESESVGSFYFLSR